MLTPLFAVEERIYCITDLHKLTQFIFQPIKEIVHVQIIG